MISKETARSAVKKLRAINALPVKSVGIVISPDGVVVLTDGKILHGYAHPYIVLDLIGIRKFRRACKNQGNVNPKWVDSIVKSYKEKKNGNV